VGFRTIFGRETEALIREIDAYTSDYGEYDPFEAVDDLMFEAAGDLSREPELHEALVTLLNQLRAERN
jgi:hypothetical protein